MDPRQNVDTPPAGILIGMRLKTVPIVIRGLFRVICADGVVFTAFVEINASVQEVVALQSSGITTDIIGYLFDVCVGALISMFTVDFSYKTVIFLVLCLCIALHMNLSGADIKGSLGAIPLLIVIIILVNVIMYFIGETAYYGFLEAMSTASAYLFAMLSLSLVFSFIVFLLGLIIGILKKVVFKIEIMNDTML